MLFLIKFILLYKNSEILNSTIILNIPNAADSFFAIDIYFNHKEVVEL